MSQDRSRVDDILVGMATGNADLQKGTPSVVAVPDKEDTAPEPIKVEHLKQKPTVDKKLPPAPPVPSEKPVPPPKPTPANEPLPAAATGNENDYGIAVETKPDKVYTEAEVQNMIRDRVERVRHERADPPKVTETKPEATEEAWQAELKSLVKDVIVSDREQVERQEMQVREKHLQNEFETKFTQGMTKYQDFTDAVSRVAVTPTMMLATRAMDAPADFLYAAAKLQPAELERISKIADHGAQLVEMGKLEATMRKTKNVTSAYRPLDNVKSDYHDEPHEKREASVDDKITEYGKTKYRRQ